MKAIVCTKYGSPDVLQLQEVEKPTPTDDQVLVRVYAASLNPADWHMRRGEPLARLIAGGLLRPKSARTGSDFAGRVEAVGRNVTQFRSGDAVFGSKRGAFAEYVCVGEKALVLKPANITFEQAAAIPVAAVTALQSLRAITPIQPGQRVLINGASGGVGTFTVQLAKAFGADVTAVCSTRNLDLVRSLGADRVVDYTQEDVTRTGQRYDLILDDVGNLSIVARLRALSPAGSCVGVGFHSVPLLFQNMILGALVSRTGRKKIRAMMAHMDQQDLVFLAELIAAGKVVPVVDRAYPLCQIAEAFRYVETGHARGKVVVTIDPDD